MEILGFSKTVRPEKLGCGTQGCAYLPNPHSDAIVKITSDIRDALVSYMIKNFPHPPVWTVPVYAVYRLPKNKYAIVTAKADPLTRDLMNALDEIYEYSYDDEGVLDNWTEEYASAKARLVRAKIDQTDVAASQLALEVINEAVVGFKNLGLDWADFHSGNWMTYKGRPVVIDFGVSKDTDKTPPVEMSEDANVKMIPVLRF